MHRTGTPWSRGGGDALNEQRGGRYRSVPEWKNVGPRGGGLAPSSPPRPRPLQPPLRISTSRSKVNRPWPWLRFDHPGQMKLTARDVQIGCVTRNHTWSAAAAHLIAERLNASDTKPGPILHALRMELRKRRTQASRGSGRRSRAELPIGLRLFLGPRHEAFSRLAADVPLWW